MESSYTNRQNNSLDLRRHKHLSQSSQIIMTSEPLVLTSEICAKGNKEKYCLIRRLKRSDINFINNCNKMNGLIKMSQQNALLSKGNANNMALENNPLLVSIAGTKIQPNSLHYYNRLYREKDNYTMKALPLINNNNNSNISHKEIFSYKHTGSNKDYEASIETKEKAKGIRTKVKKFNLEDTDDNNEKMKKFISLKKPKRYCLTSNVDRDNESKNISQPMNNTNSNVNNDSFFEEIESLLDNVNNNKKQQESLNKIIDSDIYDNLYASKHKEHNNQNLINKQSQQIQIPKPKIKEISKDQLDHITRINKQRPGTSYGKAPLRKINLQNSRQTKISLISSSEKPLTQIMI